jgi:hypothetical protein
MHFYGEQPTAPLKLWIRAGRMALAAKSSNVLVTVDGVVYVTDWNAGLPALQYEG